MSKYQVGVPILIFISAGCAEKHQPEFFEKTVCVKEETRDVQICTDNSASNAATGVLLGAVGASLLGIKAKHGAVFGGLLGAANGGTSRCHIEKETFCAKHETVKEPNPRFKK